MTLTAMRTFHLLVLCSIGMRRHRPDTSELISTSTAAAIIAPLRPRRSLTGFEIQQPRTAEVRNGIALVAPSFQRAESVSEVQVESSRNPRSYSYGDPPLMEDCTWP